MPEDYSEECQRLAREADEKLRQLHELLLSGGDEARAMDVAEARTYLEGAVE